MDVGGGGGAGGDADAAAEAGWIPPEEAEGGEPPAAEGDGAAAAEEAGGGPSAAIDLDMNEEEAETDPARAEEQRVRHVRGKRQRGRSGDEPHEARRAAQRVAGKET